MIKLYGMTEADDTMKMLRALEVAAAQRGLAVGRWDWHRTKWEHEITYKAYDAGQMRTSQGRYQQGVVAEATLSTLEGNTKRSAAYKALAGLLKEVEALPILKGPCAHCEGTGFYTVYDWVPYAGGGTQMPSDEPCPVCLGAGRCPRCGEVMDEGHVESQEACDKCGHKLFEEEKC